MKMCSDCEAKLSLGRRAMGKSLCGDCEEKRRLEEEEQLRVERREREAKLEAVRVALAPCTQGPVSAVEALPSLRTLEVDPDLDANAVRELKVAAVSELLSDLMSDGRLELWGVFVVEYVGEALGLHGAAGWSVPSLNNQAIIGKFNSDIARGSEMPNSVVAEREEELYFVCDAKPLREEVEKEIQLDQSSVSYDANDRIEVQKGTLRGKEVEIGRKIVEGGLGSLFVTSRRILFQGQGESFSIRLGDLNGAKPFSEAVRLRTNGSGPEPTFRVAAGVGDVVSAAVDHVLRVANGSELLRLDEDIPDFPRVDEETEQLLSEAVEVFGWSEVAVRQSRLLTLLRGYDRERNSQLAAKIRERRAEQTVIGGPGSHSVRHQPSEAGHEPPRLLIESEGEGVMAGRDYELRLLETGKLNLDEISDKIQPLGHFVAVRFEALNKRKEPANLSARHLLLVEVDGTQYKPWSAGATNAFIYLSDLGKVFVREELQPKLWQEGILVFDIPLEASIEWIQGPEELG
jgi:hypothetical protein